MSELDGTASFTIANETSLHVLFALLRGGVMDNIASIFCLPTLDVGIIGKILRSQRLLKVILDFVVLFLGNFDVVYITSQVH